jgi:hypothetical protein
MKVYVIMGKIYRWTEEITVLEIFKNKNKAILFKNNTESYSFITEWEVK